MTDVLAEVRAHLHAQFVQTGIVAEPDAASVTFLGVEPIEVLRFGPDPNGAVHYVSLGCSRHPMGDEPLARRADSSDEPLARRADSSDEPLARRADSGDPTAVATDPMRGPRAEVVVTLRPAASPAGLARSVAVVAAAPAVEGLVLTADALVDLGQRLWDGAPFTAMLLGRSDINDLPLLAPRDPVVFFQATPITATEAAWVRLKGADAMREAWHQDGVDVLDPARPASSAGR